MESFSIMSARRSYEYRLDDIRLTLLSNRGVIHHIREAFAFEIASAGSPMETFGSVPSTLPPGLVFDFGLVPFPEGEATAVRFIHFEQTRIVIDVAGPSAAIDAAFTTLNELLGGIRGPGGVVALGRPVDVRDYSEIQFRPSFRPDDLVPGGMYSAIATALAGPSNKATAVAVPALQVRLVDPTREYQGASTPPYDIFTLDLRARTILSDEVFYSGAPLDTDAHLALLAEIEEILVKNPAGTGIGSSERGPAIGPGSDQST